MKAIFVSFVLGTVAINCGFSANLAENPQVKATGIGNHPNFLDLPENTLSNIGREDLPETTLSTIGRALASTDKDFKTGDWVILSYDEQFCKSEFNKIYWNWVDEMRLMIGKKFPILQIKDHQTVALPSHTGAQNGKWYFPTSLLTRTNPTDTCSCEEENAILKNELLALDGEKILKKIDSYLGFEIEDIGKISFDAYRTSSFTASNSYIPLTYDAIRQSSETTGSLDTATGIFTAPIKGTYQFSMMAIEGNGAYKCYLQLKHNGVIVSKAFNNVVTQRRATVTGHAILYLQVGDKVWVETYLSVYSGSSDPMTHFIGSLLRPSV